MALGKYNRRTVMADTGAVISGATVSFYDQTTGLPVTAYSDPDGLNPVGSSIQSGPNGEVEVFLPPGKYRITTELGSYSDEITYEPIVGDLAVINATDVTNGLFLLDAPAETSFIRVFANGYSDLRTTAQVKIDLGLENVNNTSDANKPISIATQAALDLKVNNDDSRLSDAREWAADTVGQSEAETGTSTTRRAWTAQRVRQAIVAWWNTTGTTVGKALLNLTNPSATRFLRINADNTVTAISDSEMRTDLGLGTVATQTVVTGEGDTTSTRIPTVDWVQANAALRQELVNPRAIFESVSHMALSTKLAEGRIVETLGYYEKGDGGGALWDVVLTSSVTPDGFGVVQSTSVPSLSMVLSLKNKITPKMLGAVSGVGSYIAGNTSAMQLAIDYTTSNKVPLYLDDIYEHGPLVFDSGFNLIGTHPYLSAMKLHDGYHIGTDAPYYSPLTNRNILPADVGGSGSRDSGIRISKVTFDGNRDNTTGGGSEAEALSLYGVEGAVIEDVIFQNAKSDGYDIDYCLDVHLNRFIARNCGKTGVHLSVGSPQGVNQGNIGCSVRNGLVEDIDESGVTDDIFNNVGSDNTFENLIVRRCGQEGDKFGTVHIASKNSTARNITIEDCTGDGFSIGKQTNGANGITATKIRVKNSGGTGVRVASDGCHISDVIVENYGLTVASSYGFNAQGNDGVTPPALVDVSAYDITVDGTTVGSHGFRTTDLTNSSLSNIKVLDCGGRGVTFSGALIDCDVDDITVNGSPLEGLFGGSLIGTNLRGVKVTDCGASATTAAVYIFPTGEPGFETETNYLGLSELTVRFTGATAKPPYALSIPASNGRTSKAAVFSAILDSGSTGHKNFANGVTEFSILEVV